MHCQGCDYPLWNLKARQCPECGRPFLPSEFEFVPNSVRFCCPDCGQDYYGTGPTGHLVPDHFDCVRCGRALAMDEMVLLPTEGVLEEQTRIDRMPWLERGKIGFFRAWGGTIWRVMFNPGELARVTPPDASVWSAWWFGAMTLAAALMTTFGPFMLLMIVASPGRGMGLGAATGIGAVALIAMGIVAIAMPLWGVVTHLVLLFTGRTPNGLAATVRTLCYASGSGVLMAIPCLGVYLSWLVGWVWPAISAIIMLRHTQRVSGLRASIAVLTGPAIVVVAAVALFLGLIIPAASSASASFATAANSAVQAGATQPLQALEAYRARHGQYPPHAYALLVEGDLTPGQLTPPYFGQVTQRPPSILDRYDLMPDAQRQAVSAQLAAGLPANAAAHRLGDFIFTYHGIDPDTADPGVWVLIYDPPASSRGYNNQAIPIVVATAGGRLVTIPRTQFPAALTAQNALRAGLPQIPDPSAVKDPGDSGP
jgi:hypothetical protein